MNNITKYNGKLNILGHTLKSYRIKQGWSLAQTSDQLMLIGIDIPRSSIQRIECGDRILKDYELVGFSKIFKISTNVLLANFLKELE